jgi:hypothetical protein
MLDEFQIFGLSASTAHVTTRNTSAHDFSANLLNHSFHAISGSYPKSVTALEAL